MLTRLMEIMLLVIITENVGLSKSNYLIDVPVLTKAVLKCKTGKHG